MLDDLRTARRAFLEKIKSKILWVKPRATLKESIRRNLDPSVSGAVSVADIDNASSIRIAWAWAARLPGTFALEKPEQDSGKLFQFSVRDFLQEGFDLGRSVRPGDWHWKTECPASRFDQYAHLHDIRDALEENRELRTIFPEQYMVVPDIVVYRSPLAPTSLGRSEEADHLHMSPLVHEAAYGTGLPLLHASVSCKITMRSDRAQNTRTEALNLLRNRKGRAPAIVAVTAEPLPTRLASLALGTGDVDFVYHAALPELREAVADTGNEDQADMLTTLVEGRRLRDVSDLVLDLLI
ncbi:MAG: NgoMIV family type II restriction endonuclease [Candidatus Eremiobacteraeota bacterium]|nr:NgoMIV family type II restriction endonuclease [Candidatus Eremiobacteraeota bacterium]